MLILMGKTASGKTTLQNILAEKYGFKKLITYTTRPRRTGEDSNTYHFISEEEFKDKIRKDFFAEYKQYQTTEGIWYYGSAKEDYKNSDDYTIAILTPDGIRDLIDQNVNNITVFYIYSNIETISKRLKERGDDDQESKRRILSDNKNFKDADILADKIIYNNYESKLDDIVDKIIKLYKGGAE